MVNPVFESAVVQIQKGFEDELTTEQKAAVKCLLKSSVNAGQESEKEDVLALTMLERLAKLRKKEVHNNKYIKCDFIFGSVAEVEYLWSVAKTSSQRIE